MRVRLTRPISIQIGNTPLLCAIQAGNLELTKILLDHGAQIEKTNSVRLFAPVSIEIACSTDDTKQQGDSPLMLATKKFNKELSELLFRSVPNLEAVDSVGFFVFRLTSEL